MPVRPYCQCPCHILPSKLSLLPLGQSCQGMGLPLPFFFCSCSPWEGTVLPFVFSILAGTAKAQTEPVSELSELAAEVKEQENSCSICQLGR